jgi:hypothetical protein
MSSRTRGRGATPTLPCSLETHSLVKYLKRIKIKKNSEYTQEKRRHLPILDAVHISVRKIIFHESKKVKKSLNRVTSQYGYQKIVNFTLISKWRNSFL